MLNHRRTVIAIGAVASALFMYLAVRRLDAQTLFDVLSNVDPFPWIPLAIVSYLAGHVVRGARCRILLRRDANLSLATASSVVVVGYAANNVFPARLGELVRAGMLTQRTGVPIVQSLMVTLIERVLDGLAILLVLIAGMLTGVAPSWAAQVVEIALVVFGCASFGIVVAASAPGLLIASVARIGNRLGPRWQDRLVGLATSITGACACLRDVKSALLIGGLSLAAWVLEAGLFVALLPALHLPASLSLGATAMSLTNLGLLVPSSPGFIGPFHYFCSRTLMAQGTEATVALAYAAVVHLAFYVPVTLWGAAAMLWYGVEVGSTAAMARAARLSNRVTELNGVLVHEIVTLATAPSVGRASEFTRALVEAIVATNGRQTNAAALNDSANFVHRQLQCLQPTLRVLFQVGMSVFRTLTRLRYLRGYCELSLDDRQAWTAAWSNSGVAVLRRLLKPVRALALLAYYDHPLTTGLDARAHSSVVRVSSITRRSSKTETAVGESR
jgi:glycosyltransferase 2 family protein